MSDYAPQYTQKERYIFVLKQLLLFTSLYVITEVWFFDWLSEYANYAHCKRYGNITGVHLVMYGLFVGIPLAVATIVAILALPRAINVFKYGQSPPHGEKVFNKTSYKYGREAKIQPLGAFFILGMLIIFTLWGAKQAYGLTQTIKPCQPLSITANSL